jgi:hypothetical protein
MINFTKGGSKPFSLILKNSLHCFGKEIQEKEKVHQSFSLTTSLAKGKKNVTSLIF